ncbi:MAG: hypothetical protein AAGJ74_10995 [Pseudomonadota bacterium]
MDPSIISFALPLVFAALQLEALRNMTGRWKVAAFVPPALMMAGFVGLFYVAQLLPGVLAALPTWGLAAAVAYLIGLHIVHNAVTRREWTDAPEWEVVLPEEGDDEENVVSLCAYRRDAAQG